MRTIWKGFLQFSLVTIPMRLYTAVDSSAAIRFNQLHKEDHGRVAYDKTCKSCGDSLHPEDIVKGYEFAPDEYAILTDEDLQLLRLKSRRVLEIQGFVPADEIDHTLFDTPYFIGPDGEVAGKGYALLTQTLRDTGKMGVGKFSLRDREDMVLVGPHGGGLITYKVRYPETIRDIGEVPNIEGGQIVEEELKLAHHLVEAMSMDLSQIELKDTYHEAVKTLIEEKISGRQVVRVADDIKPVVDIMAALRESIAKSKGKPQAKQKKARNGVPKDVSRKTASKRRAA